MVKLFLVLLYVIFHKLVTNLCGCCCLFVCVCDVWVVTLLLYCVYEHECQRTPFTLSPCLPPCLYRSSSLSDVHTRAAGLIVSMDSAVSAFLLMKGSLRVIDSSMALAVMWVLGTQLHVLVFAQQLFTCETTSLDLSMYSEEVANRFPEWLQYCILILITHERHCFHTLVPVSL